MYYDFYDSYSTTDPSGKTGHNLIKPTKLSKKIQKGFKAHLSTRQSTEGWVRESLRAGLGKYVDGINFYAHTYVCIDMINNDLSLLNTHTNH
jgi:hypothetical protein